MAKPDYGRWGRKQLWTAIEASCLLADQEPMPFPKFMKMYNAVHADDAVPIDGDMKDSFDIYSDMKDSFDLGSLQFTEARPDQSGRRFLGLRLVRPVVCIEWARRRLWNVTAELAEAVAQWHESVESPTTEADYRPAARSQPLRTPTDHAWKQRARELFREIATQCPNLNKARLADKVAERLHAEGIRGRGLRRLQGSTILRHALQNHPKP